MSSYDKLPSEMKENVLKYVSPNDFDNMMFTSKNNLQVGKGGKNSYIRKNLPRRTVKIVTKNWLNIYDDPLASRFKLEPIMYGTYNVDVVMYISGKFYRQGDFYFLYGRFDVLIQYKINVVPIEDIEPHLIQELQETHELHLKCNFKNNKLEGLYNVFDTTFDDSIIEYREYKDDILMTAIFFALGELFIDIYDQFGNNYKQYFYNYPVEYADKDVLFEHYPKLDMSDNDSYENVENFIDNLTRGKYSEFSLSYYKIIHDNVYTYRDGNYKILKVIPNIHEMNIEFRNRLFHVGNN